MAVAAVSMNTLFSGCETAGGTSALNINPSSASLSNHTEIVTFTVGTSSSNSNTISDATLPLAWSVSDPNLGNIRGAAGYTAIYVPTGGSGVNIITVRDQTGAEGVASVQQQ